jgi:aminotransferase in exopolysaccharide biosynthesis
MNKDFIPLSAPFINGNEWKYVKECLDTGWVSSAGSYINLFEEKIARYTGSKYAVACINGTSALYISLLIAGVKPGDEVIVPTLTFIAPVNAVRYCGAFPVFMDADDYYNIDSDKTIDFILNETEMGRDNEDAGKYYCFNKKTGRRIKAIIPVHIFGSAARLDKLSAVCFKRNIKIIEDASESLGTRYNKGIFAGKHTGTIGELGCISFNGNKIITTGGGGMILTGNEEYAKRARYLTTQAKDDEINYIHNELGFNFRLSNIPAAIGVAQLEQLPLFLETKKRNYNLYKELLSGTNGLHLAGVPEYADNNYWMYALQVNREVYGMGAGELIQHLSGGRPGIQTRPVWHLNHKQKHLSQYQSYRIEKAEQLHSQTVNLPCSTGLSENEISEIIKKIKEPILHSANGKKTLFQPV